jgi:hypothetical protein
MPLFPAPISGDQSVVQVRRTTAFTLSGSFVDITFDTTDVENNTDVIEHIIADRIQIKITGKYGISYALTAPIGTQTTSLQVRLNDISVLPGSERFSTSNSDAESISGSFIAELIADGYISLQAKSSSGTPDIATGITLSIIHLAGPKGDKGDASAIDTDAIHKTTGAEISTLTEKSSPAVNDLLIIEDSDLTFIKKKLKVGNLPSGATLSDVPPVNITKAAANQGVVAAASRQDHKHDISTAITSDSAVVVGGSAAEGGLTTLARSDHLHTVTVAAPVSVGTANSAGASGNFVHSDHVHSGLTRGAGDFNVFTGKVTPVGTDLLLIEDSAAANAKKKITISALPADSTAIHKATSAEISALTEKTTPVSADLLLIEDSAASNAKKKLQIGNLPIIYGNNYQIQVSEGETTTTSSTFSTKVSLVSGAVTGTYKINSYCEIMVSTKNKTHASRLYNVTDATELCYNEITRTAIGLYMSISGFQVITFSGTSKTFAIQFASPDNLTTITIRRARLEFLRVS